MKKYVIGLALALGLGACTEFSLEGVCERVKNETYVALLSEATQGLVAFDVLLAKYNVVDRVRIACLLKDLGKAADEVTVAATQESALMRQQAMR